MKPKEKITSKKQILNMWNMCNEKRDIEGFSKEYAFRYLFLEVSIDIRDIFNDFVQEYKKLSKEEEDYNGKE